MYIVHGTWIPANEQGFVQNGAFYLWVETDTALHNSHHRADKIHPRQLVGEALYTFLMDTFHLQEKISGFPGAPSNKLDMKYFLLPTAAERPAPSFELLRYVEEEPPTEFELAPWRIQCYQLTDLIATLNTIHFITLNAASDFQLGADLLFWYQYTQAFKEIIVRDQYIPAIKARTRASQSKSGKRINRNAKDGYELHPGWEILSDVYETNIQQYIAAMPAVCAAGMNSADEASALFNKESLLRHFSECLLRDVVASASFPNEMQDRLRDTLLFECINPYSSRWSTSSRLLRKATPQEIEEYRGWLSWRKNLTRAHRNAAFTLCFQLLEAEFMDIDHWHLHFLVASQQDPSLKLSLNEYWDLPPKQRTRATKPFGQDFEKNLLLALGSAARIYPTIWEGLNTDRPSDCELTLEQAFAFLKESAWVLQDAGYTVIIPAWWTPQGRKRAKVRLKTSSRAPKKSSKAAGTSYFSIDKLIDYQYQLSIGGQVVSEAEWRQLVNAKVPLVQFRGEWMELDREKMQQLLEFWQTHQGEGQGEISLMDMIKLGTESDDLEWEHDQALSEMLAHLHDKSAFAPITDPRSLQGTLRDYQRRGVSWLQYLESLGLNPCLADDMGLGKTLEVIAHLLKEREGIEGLPPTLVIAPTSVLGNWQREIQRFAPEIRTMVHQGSTRLKDKQTFVETCQQHDVVLTSFALVRLDEKLLHALKWHRVVIDEAQNIKNPKAAQVKSILKLSATYRLALTGTPVENRLRDLWSIFNFLNPGYLGKEAQFRKSFETPIHKDNDQDRLETLKKLVEPFILRRVKTDKRIIDDLPDKIEQKMFCTLTPEQASLYEAVVKDVEEELQNAEGMQRRGLILATLMRLKQICNHPAQFLQDGSAFTSTRSHKLERLSEMLEEVIDSGESALIFTQFTEIGGALERYIEHELHYNTYYLHGGSSVSRREQMVHDFQNPETEPSIFILSLRAGGVGLNLTKANHVFHFDRWWNPAVEDQATDRAFRIGQRKNVFVHKFLTMGTMEERIDAMIEDKKRISSLVVGNDEGWLTELDNDTFKDLIALRRSAVME
ncbi:MAG TPA: DEAD/DEAH box helicase [Ktedonobacteraceae bacterium]|nr:DEAD/DEAH box helicase [Ktedonobacteraceae bacterium]